jgi:nucleoside-diphosphate-sugar epimerase
MNVFLAGATGAIGRPSIRILVARGHRVFAATRKVERCEPLWHAGAVPVVLDVLEATPVALALRATKPDAVLHQLTDLALIATPGRREESLARNAHLRKVGTANLVAAAMSAGVGCLVAQSIAWMYRPGSEPHDEDDPLDLLAPGMRGVTVDGVAALEDSVLRTPGLRGCVLRYGQLYGPNALSDHAGTELPPVHVEAAAWAAVLALEQQAAGAYNVAEPNRYARTEKVRRELGWTESLRA